MKRSIIYLLMLFWLPVLLSAQDNYVVKKAPFSTSNYDEFSPLFYQNGIVFISNGVRSNVVDVKTVENQNTFNMVFTEEEGNNKWSTPKLLSKELTTIYNDGPSTFSLAGDVVYFSSNVISGTEKKNKAQRKSRLGIFYSENQSGRWSEMRSFRFNDEFYSVTMPALSQDSKRLYFVSDMPGGQGGTDIYYCEWRDGYWDNPVNIGPVINTSGNESYPFVNARGGLFFSSDGHGGEGGKDIFYSELLGDSWRVPAQVSKPVNSAFDDFGFVVDETKGKGYFSSNRDGKMIDIYEFTFSKMQNFFSDEQQENNYTFRFTDDNYIAFDNSLIDVVWSFNDTAILKGTDVVYSFPGQGEYTVKESFFDKNGNLVIEKLEQLVTLQNIQQPYISGPAIVSVGESVSFDGLSSYLPNYEIIDYSWDMGDGTTLESATIRHTFTQSGTYKVKLIISAKNVVTGMVQNPSVYRNIKVVTSKSDIMETNTDSKDLSKVITLSQYENSTVTDLYNATEDLKQGAVFDVVVAVSESQIETSNVFFSPLASKYYVREVFNVRDTLYNYIVAEENTLQMAFQVLNDVNTVRGFMTSIETRLITDDAGKEFTNLKSVYSNEASVYFQAKDSRFAPGGIIFLNQIAALLRKYPNENLLIECHTKELSNASENLTLSKRRAQAISEYLAEKEIDTSRLVMKGYGDTRPLTIQGAGTQQPFNNRVDIFLLKNE